MLKKAFAYSQVGKKGVRVASGVAENPSEFVGIRQGEITQRWQDFLDRLAAQDDFGIGLAEVGKREVTATDLAALTYLTEKEHAIVILTDNRRVLINTGSYKGGELPPNTKILLMHSHPDDHGTGMAKFISEDDVNALVYLNQRYTFCRLKAFYRGLSRLKLVVGKTRNLRG